MAELSLHKTLESDIDFIVSTETNEENSKFIISNSKKEHLFLIKDENIKHLIVKSNDKKRIGFVILAGIKTKHKSIEFRRLVISFKGKGYGSKTIKMIKQFCFEELNCNRLWLDVLETNFRARHVYKKAGFKEEGVLRESIVIENEFKNLVIMSILKKEYTAFVKKIQE